MASSQGRRFSVILRRMNQQTVRPVNWYLKRAYRGELQRNTHYAQTDSPESANPRGIVSEITVAPRDYSRSSTGPIILNIAGIAQLSIPNAYLTLGESDGVRGGCGPVRQRRLSYRFWSGEDCIKPSERTAGLVFYMRSVPATSPSAALQWAGRNQTLTTLGE